MKRVIPVLVRVVFVGVFFVACLYFGKNGNVVLSQQKGCASRTFNDAQAIKFANKEMARHGFTEMEGHKVLSNAGDIKKFCEEGCENIQLVVTMNAKHWAANGVRGYKICINKDEK